MENSIGNVRQVTIEDEMRGSYLEYAMSVIIQRALPDVRDGLKPVHRRILHAMNELRLGAGDRYRKSAAVVGEVLGKYHPHGDVAVYDTIVRMAQDFSMRYPLIDGQGNFGSVDGDSAAAMRYTEVRMAAIAEELLTDIDRDTVDWMDNYDGTHREPRVLPAKLPNLLLNGMSGIAVGMATSIPPHNLRELCRGIILLIRTPEATVTELNEVITGPDFPTAGTLYGAEGIRNAYATGRGRMILRAEQHVEELPNGRTAIIVTELPYQVNKALLQERIAELVNEHRIDGIAALRDETDRQGMRLVIELKRDAQVDAVLNALFKHTPMQSAISANMLALVDGQPRVLSLEQMLRHYLAHRRDVVTRRTRHDLEAARRRVHVLEGLSIAINNVDAVVALIRGSASADVALRGLMDRFALSETQGRAILDMRLARLAALERQKVEDDLAEVRARVADLEGILANAGRIDDIIVGELEDLAARFGDDRRTRIVAAPIDALTDADLIAPDEVVVTMTGRGYIKRVPSSTYSAQGRGGKGILGMVTREEDAVERLFVTNTHDNILFFTNKGHAYQLKVYEVPEAGRTARGVPIANIIATETGERVTAALTFSSGQKDGSIIMATTRGTIKRTPLHDFRNVRRSGLIAIGLADDDELAWVQLSTGTEDLVLVTSDGRAIRFKQDDVRPMGRPAAGVRGIRLQAADRVVAMGLAHPGGDLLIVTEEGYGKRTPLADYPVHGRGGGGVATVRPGAQIGSVVAAATTTDAHGEMILMSAGGKIIRQPVGAVPRLGRATQGVRLMRLNEGDSVVSLAFVGDGAVDH
ncbi:MAG TPA: DNA gyrase subunit A [Chloroflexota bacterium]|nr:DNA gyrase subunit A [Chloroflexota bacterium]